MNHFLKIIYIVIFNFAFCVFNYLNAQTYPVTLNTQLIPPFSGYLPDYSALGNEKLKVLITFNDFTKPNYQVKLKIKIDGQGITIQSKSFYFEGPITLEPGVPLFLSGADLGNLLNSNNLDFSGISKAQYEQRKVLPEGFYSVCITAYDNNNPNPIAVSNTSCAYGMMVLSDPPYLNIPTCGSSIAPANPQQVIFNWTPINQASPNSAGQTDYVFELFEVRPAGQNPNNIVQTLPPIYTETIQTTSLNYGITETPLINGMEYVWRVRAVDQSGRDLFKNQGYSQICTFTYGNSYTGANLNINLTAQPISHRQVKAVWDSLNLYTNYKLEFQKVNGTPTWFPINTPNVRARITSLEPNTNYKLRVQGKLPDGTWGPMSNEVTVSTTNVPSYACGEVMTPFNTQNFVPLTNATIGMIWDIGQFEIVVNSLQSTMSPNGQYSGTGQVKVAFAGDSPFLVKFNNIIVNNEMRIVAGKVDVITKGIDKWLSQINLQNAEDDATYIEGSIDSVYVSGNQFCYTIQNQSTPVCANLPDDGGYVVIRDNDGNQYSISNPPPTVTGPSSYLTVSSDILQITDSTLVTFEASPNQAFGFDKKEYAANITNYELLKYGLNKNYFVPYKSIDETQTDELLANIQINNFKHTNLSFKTQSGTALTSTSLTPTQYKITGIPATANCVYAYYNNKKIGKLNIVSLKPITKKLVLVPVNGASLPSGEPGWAALNAIYKQANVAWTLTTASAFNFNLGSDGLQEADATLLAKYSAEMRALRDAYKQATPNYDKDAYYIFVVPNFSNTQLKGYMVRGRALGFVTANATAKEVAHELAHGAFGLEHTFPKIEQSTTNNLLDYGNGEQLTKVQWMEIQNPTKAINWRDDEEEAQYYKFKSADKIFVFETLKQIKLCYQKNINYPISQIPDGWFSGYRIENVTLAGVQYNYIRLYKDLRSNTQKTSITPKNNISSEEKSALEAGSGETTLCGLIKIDNAIYIEVPANRRLNMQNYLSTPESKNLLLFVNGYRNNAPSTTEYPNSSNKIYSGDPFSYWDGLDAEFMNRLKLYQVVYADGHHSINTSNHYTQARFTASLISSKDPTAITLLNTIPNTGGFGLRKANGMAAAIDLLSKINNYTISFNKQSDTLFVVCHSMGFAYAQGMIDALRQAGVKITRYYIIAPENGCSENVDVNSFEEVWQYGSDENNHPPKKRDGVAPQCPVGNMQNKRAYIPDDVEQDFLNSHYISNYHWIFSKLNNINDNGYVHERK